MRIIYLLTLLLAGSAMAAGDPLTQPIRCEGCAGWNRPVAPFKIFGDSYYVGVQGISSVLIVAKEGMVLIDGDLPQSAPRIEANIRALGFRVEDIRLIVTSHEHFDHVGGIAALQRDSGAHVLSSPDGARALMAGHTDREDPQFLPKEGSFPPVRDVETLSDQQIVRVGDIALTAHFTPGHTAGGVSWTWRSCEGERCLDMVFGDSLSPLAFGDYRFSDRDRADRFRATIARVGALPCDILITTHPDASHLWERLKAGTLIDPSACHTYANAAMTKLEQRLAEEGGGP